VKFPDSSKILRSLARLRGEVEMEDDRLSWGSVGRGAVGFVPDRARSDEEGRAVMIFSASGVVRSCAADMDGRSRRGVTDPLVPSRDNEETSSPLTEGPVEG
jgi:hypothetical protein